MRFGVHFANRGHGTAEYPDTRSNDDDKAFAVVAFCTFQHFQFALVIVIVAGDAYGIDAANCPIHAPVVRPVQGRHDLRHQCLSIVLKA